MNSRKKVMSELPFDIVSDILLRLPVRSLCRFKCVSKPWLFHISSPNFAKNHLDLKKRNQKQQSEKLLYLSESFDCYSVGLESPDSTAVQLRFQTGDNPMQFNMISGSCNGLVLLSDSDLDLSMFLVNPSTRECRKLPQCPFFIASVSALGGYGFGYDSSCDDYKVVIISVDGFGFKADEIIVSVYNLKANSWRRIKGFPYRLLLFFKLRGIFVNGGLHWPGAKDITALDLASESFSTVHLPRDGNEVGRIEALSVIGDCLCGFELSYYRSVPFNVWVMKEYGVRDSWIKFFVINFPNFMVLPSMASKLLLYTGRKIVVYDLQERTYELIVQDIDAYIYVTYEESLIRLHEQCEYGEQN